MKVLVTGADGLLGSNLVRTLLNRGYSVRALIQPGRKAKTLQGLPIEIVHGDILDVASLEAAFTAVDYVIHAAASTSIYPARNAMVWKVNVEGTQNVVAQALKSKIKRLVYVGTANSFGFGTKKDPGVEGNPYRAHKYSMDYMDSKKKAQEMVLKAVEKGLSAIVVNPTFMIGPYDSTPSSGAMVLAVHSEKIPGFAPGGRNYIYVKDAATGMVNALTMGRIGECYIIGNENLSYREAFQSIAEAVGAQAPRYNLPKLGILAYGMLGNIVGKISGKPPKVSLSMARISCDHHYFTAAKAVRELELPQTPIKVAFEECFQWLKENNYLDKK